MNTRSHLSLIVLLGLVVLGTLALAASLTSLHVTPGNAAWSVPVLYNQGNADAAQGRTGSAIVNYERARLLAPADPDIAANLQWVRDHAGLSSTSATWLDRATSWASPNTMALLGWLGLLLAGTSYLYTQSFRQHRMLTRLAACAGIVLFGLSALSAWTTWQTCHRAVVITQDAAARISPVTNAETSFKLRPGEMVAINGHYHNFTLVQNSTGHAGWVAQADITPLIPQ